MNKKKITQNVLIFMMLFVTTINYAKAETPIFKWADQVAVDGKKATSVAQTVKTNLDKDIFIMSEFGTVTDKDQASFNDNATFFGRDFYGAKYGLSGGNSANKNLLITKSDVDGNLKWAIHTDAGDFSASASVMIPTSDGGCFLALKMRNSDKNSYNDSLLIRIVSDDGSKNEIKWVPETDDGDFHSIYQPVFVKIDGSGMVTTIKKADVDYSAMPNASHYNYGTPDGFYFYGGDQDSEGNIFIGGNLRKKLSFSNGEVINPHNTSGWDGDSQDRVGSLFVVKLDEEANYIQHFTSDASDEIAFDNVKLLEVSDDNIYIAGNVMGNNTNSFHIGRVGIIPNEFQSTYVAKLNKYLDVQWAQYYPFVKTQKRKDWKLSNLTVTDDQIFINGGIAGGFAKADAPTTTIAESGSNWLNGFLIKSNKATGEILDATVEESSWIGLSFSTIATNDSVYMYGYDWGNSDTYDKWYIYLRAYSKEDLTPGKRYSLMEQNGMSTAWGAVAVDNKIIALGRYKKSPIKFLGSDISFESKGYTGVVAAWEFPGKDFFNNETASVEKIDRNSSDIIAYTYNQNLLVKNVPANETVQIYTITGQCVAAKVSSNSDETITFNRLPVGVYIIRTNTANKKIIIR